MSLSERLTELNSVFTDPDRWGMTVEFWPAADKSKAVSINVSVDSASLPGTNENLGDGVTLNRPSTRSVRESIDLLVPVGCITLQYPPSDEFPDCFRIGGILYAVKRITQGDPSDVALKVRCIRRMDARVRNTNKVG